jgi:hypothetical protein
VRLTSEDLYIAFDTAQSPPLLKLGDSWLTRCEDSFRGRIKR